MWVKICGIRDVETALHAAELGVNAIGLNFYAKSPRQITVSMARQIVAQLPNEVAAIGLFVNSPPAEIAAVVAKTGLHGVQWSGDENVDDMQQLIELLKTNGSLSRMSHLIRSCRVDSTGLAGVDSTIRSCRDASVPISGCLLDSKVSGSYGGTGHVGPWDVISAGYNRTDWPSLILAGGLTPANVAAAVRAVSPWGVDVASGVESSVGCKDLELMRQFVAQARSSAAAC